jgi:uncharacterized protein (DUF302 family)
MSSELPVDPTAIDSEDRGERRAVLDMDHAAAVDHVRSALTDAGFGVATEFSPAEMLNEKVDAGRDPYTIIGACNPAVADDALTETGGEMGGLFPCNVAIWERADGKQVVFHVSIMKVARLVGLAPDTEAWEGIVERTGEYLDDAWAALDQN